MYNEELLHRAYPYDSEKKVDLCPHIQIINVEEVTDDCYEYEEPVNLFCKECNEEYTYRLAIN